MQYSKPIKFEKTTIEGLVTLDLTVYGDARGWFKENFQRAKMTENAANSTQVSGKLKDIKIVQNNISFNAKKGVTRGLHAEPWDKFISVATGSVFGAWVDLRYGSKTYGKSFTTVIDPSKAIFVHRGVANGFQSSEDNTAYTYLVNDHWSANAGDLYTFVSIFDESLNINWPISLNSADVEISDKDRAHPMLVDVKPMLPKKTLVIGANGQLGRAVQNFVQANIDLQIASTYIWADILGGIGVNGREIVAFDCTNEQKYSEFDWAGIGTIINCAGYTNVDGAQTPSGRKLAWKINASAPALLAKIANEFDITLVHVSSDYVLDGDLELSEEHLETEEFAPLGVYAQTKAAGDIAVQSAKRHYIARTSWVVGDGHNFIEIMRNLAKKGVKPEVVNDQFGRLTFAKTLCDGIFHLLQNNCDYGVYNVQNSGEKTTWNNIASLVFERVGKSKDDVTGVSTDHYFKLKIAEGVEISPRPINGVLCLDKIRATGFALTDWKTEFENYMNASSNV